MGFYDRVVLPKILTLAMASEQLAPYRARVIAQARGRVLEVGIGPGLNLPLYGAAVTDIRGVDPSAALLEVARKNGESAGAAVELLLGSSEALPVDDGSVDTVVTTWTLCTIPDAAKALAEMRRVLRPDGQLLFVEHGLSPEHRIETWQNRLTPVWKHICGGCHLNRPIEKLVTSAGFAMEELKTGYMKGPKPMTFMYEGRARPR